VLQREAEPIPEPVAGQALVRNRYLSLDPSNRIWMGEGESYMPPVKLGEVMRGLGVGEVVASRTRKYPVGARVLGLLGWQDYALISPTDAMVPLVLPRYVPAPMTKMLGALGVTGLTAYFGMLDIGRPKRGETVVVSAAAGAVGSIAGQIAKLRGARVVGIAGSAEKCAWLTGELGFDAAICRRDGDWRPQLADACPEGVDVDFENVGGEIMEAVFERLNHHARVVLCGLISGYGADGRAAGSPNVSNLVMRRIRVQGFNVIDYLPRFPVATLHMGVLILLGRLRERHTLVVGLDAAPAALVDMFHGRNIGKLLVQIDGTP